MNLSKFISIGNLLIQVNCILNINEECKSIDSNSLEILSIYQVNSENTDYFELLKNFKPFRDEVFELLQRQISESFAEYEGYEINFFHTVKALEFDDIIRYILQ